jgi:hypothetical protein
MDSKAKYGYAPPPATYTAGTWAVAPRRVLAWTSVAHDPTRFEFQTGSSSGGGTLTEAG